jgi:hypothetical protein
MDPTLFAIRKARCTRFRWMIYFLALFVIVTVVERCVYYPETVLGTNQFDDMLVYLHRTDQYHKVSAAELGEQTPSSALYLVELIWESSSRADHLGLWGVIKRHEWEVRCVQEFNADIRRLHYNKTRAGDVMPYPPDLSQWSVAIAEYTGDSDSGRAIRSASSHRAAATSTRRSARSHRVDAMSTGRSARSHRTAASSTRHSARSHRPAANSTRHALIATNDETISICAVSASSGAQNGMNRHVDDCASLFRRCIPYARARCHDFEGKTCVAG